MLVNRSFTYTLAGQLKTVSVNGTLRATYFYNHLSQRTRKLLASPPAGTPAVTLYRYDPNGRLVEEIAGSAASAAGISVTAGQSLVTYVWMDETPSAIVHAGNSPANAGNAQERVIYLHTDHLETPRKASDANARIVWSWEADAFGAAAPNEDVDGDGKATTVNLRFPGQFFDGESGLHYNWHRYYDARNGRYIQSDPIGLAGGITAYAYAEISPLLYVDPHGLSPFSVDIWPPALGPTYGIGDACKQFCRSAKRHIAHIVFCIPATQTIERRRHRRHVLTYRKGQFLEILHPVRRQEDRAAHSLLPARLHRRHHHLSLLSGRKSPFLDDGYPTKRSRVCRA
jgi:RHS repeat-associated protein